MSAVTLGATRVGIAGPGVKPLDRRGVFAAVPLATSLLLGISLYARTPLLPAFYGVAAATLAVLSLLLHRRCVSTWLLLAGFALIGLSTAQSQWFSAPRGDIAYYTSGGESLARLRFRIVDVPRSVKAEGHRPAAQYARAQVLAVRCRGGWRESGGGLLLRVTGSGEQLTIGDECEALGSLYRVVPPGNPGEFDLQRYQRLRGVYARFSCEGSLQRLTQRGEGGLDWARRQVRQALDKGFASSASGDLALAKILLLGDSDPSLGEVREDFRRTGTTHHLSISGTHIAVLTLFVFFLCRLVRLHPARAAVAGMVFALAYGLVVVPSPPVVRSVLLCLAIGSGLIFRRRVEPVQLLALAAVLMLCYDPRDAFDPGFQLSFAAVLGLMLLASSLAQALRRLENEHVRMARQLQPPKGWRVAALWLREECVVALAAGLVAWLVSMPLIAWHFRQLNPWAVPASIVLGFLVAATLITGFLKVAVTLLFPPVAPLLASPLAMFAGWMRALVHAMAAVPATDAAVYPMPLWLMLVYYALVALPLLPPLQRRRRIWLAPLAAGVLASTLPLAAMSRSHMLGPTRLTCLSVGAGSCAVAQSQGAAIMVDAGSLSPAVGERIIEPFLRCSDLSQIDALYLTHGDADHISEAASLLEAGRVKLLVVGADARWTGPLQSIAAAHAVAVREVRYGESLSHGNMRVTVLGPPAFAIADNSNDSSLVLLLEAEGRRVLFTGDIGEKPRRELTQSQTPIAADILLAPHHGSVTLWTKELIECCAPKVIISSDSWRLSGAQKKLPSLLPAASLYRTGERGAVSCEWSSGSALRVNCFHAAN